jgi:hypothetical protein
VLQKSIVYRGAASMQDPPSTQRSNECVKLQIAGIGAVLLLASLHVTYSAEPSIPRESAVAIGEVDGLVKKHPCRVLIHTKREPTRNWYLDLFCFFPPDMKGIDSAPQLEAMEAASFWLLLDDGKAAEPVAPADRHKAVGVTGDVRGGQAVLSMGFWDPPGDPTAVVVKFDGKLHVFPISKEHRLRALETSRL